MLEGSEFAKEAQALLSIENEEFIEEQTTEQGGEDFDVDEEVISRGDPSITIEREATARDDEVHMGMMGHSRAPGVEHADETKTCA